MIATKVITTSLLVCSLLDAATISSFTSNRNRLLVNGSAVLTLNYSLQNSAKHHKIEYTVKDPSGKNFPNSFSATSLNNVTWRAKDAVGFYTINAKVYEEGVVAVDRDLQIEVYSDYCNAEVRLGGADDSYFSVDMLHQFKLNGVSYSRLYAGTNGYVTFDRGYTSYGSNISSILHGIFPNTNRDLMTHIYVTKCTDKTLIRWEGGYYPNWQGTWNYTLTLFKDNSLLPSNVSKR